MIHQQDKVKYGTATIPYYIIKTGRIKTSELIVDADTITVRAPLDKDKVEIQKIVLDKASWILKKQKEYKETIPQITKPLFKENTTLPYLGTNYSLKINKRQAKNSIEIVDGYFLVGVKSAMLSQSILKKLYENWMKENAPKVFESKVKRCSKEIKVKVRQIIVKNLKKKMGQSY